MKRYFGLLLLLLIAALTVSSAQDALTGKKVILAGTVQAALGGKAWDSNGEITRMKEVSSGVFEFAAFENGTRTLAHAIAESSAFSIAGGGDTLAAIAKYKASQDKLREAKQTIVSLIDQITDYQTVMEQVGRLVRMLCCT